MQRKLIVLALLLMLVAPVFAQRGSGRGSGTQVRQRIHQPGTGQQTGTAVQKRDRKRDGTGVKCPNGPCAQQQTQTQTEEQTQTQTRTTNKTRTRTQQSTPTPKN